MTTQMGLEAAGVSTEVQVPDGFWQREPTHFPQPLSPVGRTTVMAVPVAATRAAFAEMGLLADRMDLCEIGGWVYMRFVPLGGKDRKPPPRPLMPFLLRLVPQLRSRIKIAREAMRSDKPSRLIERWYAEWKPQLIDRSIRLRTADLPSLADADLDAHLSAARELLMDGARVHFILHVAIGVPLADLAFACRDLLGWDDRRTLDLLAGLSERSTEPASRLAALAAIVRERPALRQAIEGAADLNTVDRAALDASFGEAFETYQQAFGYRALRFDPAEPTLIESPGLMLGLICDQLDRGYDPTADATSLAQKRQATAANARDILASRSPSARQRFEQALGRAERAYPVREDNEISTISTPIAVLRFALLEVGRRLAVRGQLDQCDGIFWLEFEEARSALRGRVDHHALVNHRQAERSHVEAHPGPASYGRDPGPPPSMDLLPSEMRHLMEAFSWYMGHIMEPPSAVSPKPAGSPLKGIIAAPGRYTGPVRVVLDESEFDKIQPGDVLVCPITSPVWSVLFPSVGALITDTGGILSHSAIIAREYRIPAVVSTGNATRVLADGQVVTVNGDAGTVEVLP